ncbi:MAG: AMP-binding protein [Acidimicrobiales bacterium]
MLQPFDVLPRTTAEPDAEAIWTDDRTLSWAELEERSRRFAQGLRSVGVDAGDHWALLARNRFEWAELSIGNGRAGARSVPLNWHLTAREIAELLEDSGSKLLVVADELADVGRAAAAIVGLDQILVLGDDYEAWLMRQSSDPLEDGPLGSPLQYTGGTTGRSKGVIRSDQAGRASSLAETYSRWGTLTDARVSRCCCAPRRTTHSVVRCSARRSPEAARWRSWMRGSRANLAVIAERQVVGTAMVPTQFIRLLKLEESIRNRFDVSSLRWVLHTAAPCPKWVKQAMIEWFGPVITELYGSSEGVGPVIATAPEWLERPGTVGRATAVLELSILDDDGDDLPARRGRDDLCPPHRRRAVVPR